MCFHDNSDAKQLTKEEKINFFFRLFLSDSFHLSSAVRLQSSDLK